jgi:LPS-assembly protein
MTGFSRRPLALFVSCLFAGAQVSQAAVDEGRAIQLAAQAGGEKTDSEVLLLAANDVPVNLRVEKKFNVMKREKPPKGPATGLETPVELKRDDDYPMFLIADQIEGRTDDVSDAEGNVELRKTGMLLFADHLTYRSLEDEAEATGKVRLIQEGAEVDTPHLRMKLSEQIGFAEQADYHVVNDVKARLYRPLQQTLSSVAQATSSSSGSPMTLYVPNSYGLPTVGPARRETEASGHAERVDFEGENHMRLTDATYSTCKPGQTDWFLRADQIALDYDENKGTADNASLWFKDVPLFYTPVASFALNHQRRSGFLHPTFSSSTRSGFDFTAPLYWNIAPDYDATFYPRYMSKRGFQLGSEARYGDYNYQGTARLEYLPEDALLHRDRYAYSFLHTQDLGLGFAAKINWNGVSDDTYWQDMTSRLMQTSQVQLPRELNLAYSPASWLQSNIQVLRYQTLQPDPTNLVKVPYFLEPQINLFASRANVLNTDLMVLGQFSRFTHTDISKPEGDRLVFYPQVSLPIITPAFQITPKVGLHMTKYSLDRQVAGEPTNISRVLPTFTLDSSVVFERETSLFGNAFVQTLEPRLYYVNIPYKDQHSIPVFDSGLADFNFAQIFSENRYSGFDRINDANQLTAALTTTFLDPTTGVESFRAMIGQRYYFRPQRVTITDETTRVDDFSNLIAAVTGLVAPKTYADAAWEYNYRNSDNERFSLGMRYQPDFAKVLSASYRYTRDAYNGSQQVDQFDLAAQWPIAPRWYAVGRFNYSLRDNHPLETIAGFEYNAGCWAGRFVAQRLEAISGSPNTSIFFQLELNDFGSIGSNPLQLLRRSIPGYGKVNELSSGGNMLTP